LGDVAEIQGPAFACRDLATTSRKAFSYLERVHRKTRRDSRIGTNVFIGHGGSKSWRELKDFVEDRLHLPADEFNRVPVAGITNIARLSEMLEAAAIALIVMTAEDEQPSGKVRARMNVIHEAGLFQGRLGFTKAIILLEEGCEEFSNIEGLGQIRFPTSNISACFEEVRKVLEREGMIEEK
jgi:predicted nucleotide-binding protein